MSSYSIQIEPGDPFNKRLLAIICFCGLILCICYLIIFFGDGEFLSYTLFNASSCIIFIIVLILNHLDQPFSAKVVLGFSMPVMLLGYTWFFGNIGAEVYLLAGGAFLSYMFKLHKTFTRISIILVLSTYIASKIILIYYHHQLILSEVGKIVYIPNMLAGSSLIFVGAVVVKRVYQKQNEKLEQLNALKSQLISIISHDVRSPLSSLAGVLHLMEDQSLSREEISELSTKIAQQLYKTTDMLDNLLIWVKNESLTEQHKIASLNVNDVIKSNLDLLRIKANEKEIRILNQIDDNLVIQCNKEALNIIIRNLISNAIKFSHPHQSIIVSAKLEGKSARFCIEDQGIGMNETELTNLKSGIAKSKTGTINEKGTGLGFRITLDLIQRMKGKISIESQPNLGTKVHFELPSAPIPQSE